MNATINANLAECIKSADYFGRTVYVNVCNGSTTTVPWGSADWALVLLFAAGGATVIALFAVMTAIMWRDS